MKNKLFPTLLLTFFLSSFNQDSSWIEVTSEQKYDFKIEDFKLGNKFYFVKNKSITGLKVGEYMKITNKYSWNKKYLNKVYIKQ